MTARAASRVTLPAVGALVVLTVVTAVWSAWVDAPRLAAGAQAFDWPRAALVAALYLSAHLLRIARMLVILGDSATSVRAVALAHALTAPVSGLTPFKAGEVVRVVAFGLASEGPVHGLRAVWIERSFDAAVLASAGLLALAVVPEATAVVPVTAVAVAVLTVTAVAIAVLPENVGMAKAWLIRRYTTAWSLRALALLHDLGAGLRRSRALVRRKVATLSALTLALWGLETAALTLLVGAIDLHTVLAGVLSVLSGLVLPTGGAGGLEAWIPVHRLVVFATVNGFAAVALAALLLRPSRGRGRHAI